MNWLKIKPRVQYWRLFCILAISSIYMGLLISLHFVWYPGWTTITIHSLEENFNRPVKEAVRIFKPLVIVMDFCALVLVLFENGKIRRVLYVCLTGLAVLFTLLSVIYVLPLNEELATLANENLLKEKLLLWMRYNDFRMIVIGLTWLLTVFLISRPGVRSELGGQIDP